MYKTSITLSKILKLLISQLHLGTGYTWAGHFALKLYPRLLSEKALLPRKGILLVSGTNGKTTTAKIICHVLQKNGFTVATNASGANLLNGIAAALLLNTDIYGNTTADYGVLEVDEFTLPLLLSRISPNFLVLLNLSRDQLDRYGETDIILSRWTTALENLSDKTTLLLNKNQKDFAALEGAFKGRCIKFDTTGFAVIDVLKSHFGISSEEVSSSLASFQPAWGRGETVRHNNFDWHIHLAKNPASFDNNLQAVSSNNYLFIFNDNIPDGRDVSWIYDISTELLRKTCLGKNIYVSGKRAFDMAVRLQYAGISIERSKVIPNIREAVLFVENANVDKSAVAFPNYSAMLELRKILLGRSIL